MESSTVHVGFGPVLRVSAIASFVVVTLLTFLISQSMQGVGILLFDVLVSYSLLGVGILIARPDLEVLAWVTLGTGLVVAMAVLQFTPLGVMAAGLAIVCLADFDHTVAIMYPRGGTMDTTHEAGRRHLLIKRMSIIGATAMGSLAVSVLGVSLAPPLVSREPTAVVGIFAIVALLLLVVVTSLDVGQKPRVYPSNQE